ncbi:MAG: hypothetical protein EA408_04740 [Marinilabiliales bacterium]|nr:MAG: hypothetical protein EA408_04740 [Marinilabiliales bacterium]
MESIRLLKYLFRHAGVIALALALFSGSGCRDRIPEQKSPQVERTVLNAAVIADTVIYDVIVKNPDAEDLWTEETLRNLNRGGFVDIIFNAVYREELVAFDYFTGQALTVRDVADLENDPEFSRENIGMLQFNEEWYFDEENLRMEKRVNSVSLGYEVYDAEGRIRGYKPAFLINLN